MGKRIFTIILCLLLGSSIILLASCNNESSIISAENESVTLNSSTAGNNISQVSYFPVQKPGYESLPYPAALAQGKLVLHNGHLLLKPAMDILNVSEGLLIIWPPGSTLTEENGDIQVLNSEGQCIAKVGEELNIGGGEINNEIVLKYTGVTVPGYCTGPYWLASPGVFNGEQD